jgi:hypothetical protein
LALVSPVVQIFLVVLVGLVLRIPLVVLVGPEYLYQWDLVVLEILVGRADLLDLEDQHFLVVLVALLALVHLVVQ